MQSRCHPFRIRCKIPHWAPSGGKIAMTSFSVLYKPDLWNGELLDEKLLLNYEYEVGVSWSIVEVHIICHPTVESLWRHFWKFRNVIISSTEHFGYFRVSRNRIQLLTVENIQIFVSNVLKIYYLKLAENNNFNTKQQTGDVQSRYNHQKLFLVIMNHSLKCNHFRGFGIRNLQTKCFTVEIHSVHSRTDLSSVPTQYITCFLISSSFLFR